MVAKMVEDPTRESAEVRNLDASLGERAAIAARVTQEARELFSEPNVDPLIVDRYAREAVDELWAHPPKITGYVPLLALRRVHERLAKSR